MSKKLSRKIHKAAAMHIVGLKDKLVISGPKEAVDITRAIIEASKDLYEKLHNINPNITSINEAVSNKKHLAKKFKEKMGFSWLL